MRVFNHKSFNFIMSISYLTSISVFYDMWKLEAEFLQKYQDEGWTVFKNGWPDFLLVREEKGILTAKAVEVKGVYKHGNSTTKDHITNNQKAMLGVLPKLGIPVEVVYRLTEHRPQRRIPVSASELRDMQVLEILKERGLDAAKQARSEMQADKERPKKALRDNRSIEFKKWSSRKAAAARWGRHFIEPEPPR